MKLGFFTMPIHPLEKDWRQSLKEDREAFVAARREEYEEDVDIVRLASELVVDSIIEPEDLRVDLIRRFGALTGKDRSFSRRRHGVTPV